jgi:hypothetical protein
LKGARALWENVLGEGGGLQGGETAGEEGGERDDERVRVGSARYSSTYAKYPSQKHPHS